MMALPGPNTTFADELARAMALPAFQDVISAYAQGAVDEAFAEERALQYPPVWKGGRTAIVTSADKRLWLYGERDADGVPFLTGAGIASAASVSALSVDFEALDVRVGDLEDEVAALDLGDPYPPVWKGGRLPVIVAPDALGVKRQLLYYERDANGNKVLAGEGVPSGGGGGGGTSVTKYGEEREVAVPSLLGWNLPEYPNPIIKITADPVAPFGRLDATPLGLLDAFLPSSPNAVTLYVATNGSDSTGDGTIGAPYRSIWKAQEAAVSLGAGLVVINVQAGTYQWSQNATRGGEVGVTIPTMLIANGGTVISGTHRDYAGASVERNATYPHIWQFPEPLEPRRALDTLRTSTNNLGNMPELTRLYDDPAGPGAQTALEKLATRPDCWAWDGTNVYCWRNDGLPVTRDNTRFLLPKENLYYTNRVPVYVGAGDAGSRWEFQGGESGAVFGGLFTGSDRHCLLMERVTSSYSNGNAFGVNAVNGLVALFNCHATAAAADGINFHRTLSGSMYTLTVNCSAWDNGRGGNSRNAHTLHEDVTGIDIGGDYRLNRGGSIGHVNNAKALHVGSVVQIDLGDSSGQAAIKVGNNVRAWLDGCVISVAANTDSIRNTSVYPVYISNMQPPRGNVVGVVQEAA